VIFKKPPKPTKTDMLAAKPQRATSAEEKSVAPGKWQLTVPVQPSRWASLVLRVPSKGLSKTFELDELGKFVWDACDGKSSVRQVIRKLAKQYNLNQREAEVATVAFLKTLTSRGLVAMAVDKK
jgi:hypothetical protein